MFAGGLIIRSVQALISDTYNQGPAMRPLVGDVGPRIAWTSGGPLMAPESSEDLDQQHKHASDSGDQVPLREVLEVEEEEPEDGGGLPAGRSRKRKMEDEEEELQDEPLMKKSRRWRSADVLRPDPEPHPAALRLTQSHDYVKTLHWHTFDSGPQVDLPPYSSPLPPDYSPLTPPEETWASGDAFITSKEGPAMRPLVGDVGPRIAWTSGGPLMAPESSEDLDQQHKHASDSGDQVPLREVLEVEEEEPEDGGGLPAGRSRKRKMEDEEEELQDEPLMKKSRRWRSADVLRPDPEPHPAALRLTQSHDYVKTLHWHTFDSGPQVDLPPYSSPPPPYSSPLPPDYLPLPPYSSPLPSDYLPLPSDYSPLTPPEETWASGDALISNREYFAASYEELKVLGEGYYGKVFEAVRVIDSKPVAIKHIPREKVEFSRVYAQCGSEVSEVLLMQSAAGARGIDSEPNPAIIGFEEVIDLGDEVVIVMERPEDAVDLLHLVSSSIQPMQEHDAKIIIKQVVDASVLMHRNGVFHSDIKASNILVSSNDQRSVKIVDFGCAERLPDVIFQSYCGTLRFAPPEIQLHYAYEAEPTTVWQIGMLLTNIFTELGSWERMIRGQRTIENLSKEGNHFMRRCLRVDPTQRARLTDLQRHPWFDGLTTP